MSQAEAAEVLGVSPATIRDLILDGSIAAVTLTDKGRLRVVTDSLDAYWERILADGAQRFGAA